MTKPKKSPSHSNSNLNPTLKKKGDKSNSAFANSHQYMISVPFLPKNYSGGFKKHDSNPELSIENRKSDDSLHEVMATFSGRVVRDDVIHLIEQPHCFPDRLEGLHVWEAGIVLLRFLLTNQEKLLENRRILELGAGTGFCSLGLAKTNQYISITATDSNPAVLTNLRQNHDLNFRSERQGFTIKEMNFETEWDDVCDEDKADLIIAADVLYGGIDTNGLANTIDHHLIRKHDKIGYDHLPSLAIIVYPSTRQTVSHFTECMERRNFNVSHGLVPKRFCQTLAGEVSEVAIHSLSPFSVSGDFHPSMSSADRLPSSTSQTLPDSPTASPAVKNSVIGRPPKKREFEQLTNSIFNISICWRVGEEGPDSYVWE
eukprot:Platyproteum_vivax@DN2933_c0_g1_i1.p1